MTLEDTPRLMEVVDYDGGVFSFDDDAAPAVPKNSWRIEIKDDDIYWDGKVLISRHADPKKLGKIIKRAIAKRMLEIK